MDNVNSLSSGEKDAEQKNVVKTKKKKKIIREW